MEEVIDITGAEGEDPIEAVPSTPKWWGGGPIPTLEDLNPKQRIFPSLQLVKDTIKYVTVLHKLPCMVKQSCVGRFEVGCFGKAIDKTTACLFHIKARAQEKLNGSYIIIKSDLTHTCDCMFTVNRKVRGLGARFVSRQAEGFLADCPKATPLNVSGHIQRTLGAGVSYRTAHRGKRLCIEEMVYSETTSFQFIEPFFAKIKAIMPGSVAVMERDDNNSLLRTFVMLKPLIDSFEHGMPVITVDACHLRSSFKGCLMAITMMDGLKQTQLLAWGTCPVENSEHWDWFVKLFRDNMPQESIGYGPVDNEDNRRVITIVSDREKGIAKALYRHFPCSYHVFCFFHIEKNVKSRHPGLKDEVRQLMLSACKAKRETTFDRLMARILVEAPTVYEYLASIPLDKWATSHTLPNRKWDVHTSNASESMNKWMNEERNLSHCYLHGALVSKVMVRQNVRRKEHMKYVRSSPTCMFPKKIQALLLLRMERGSKMNVKPANQDKYLVASKWEVNLNKNHAMCSCKELLLTGLPCEHMAAAVQSVESNMESELEGRGLISMSDFVMSFYSQQSISSFYRAIVEPCALNLEELRPDKTTLPMEEHKQAGRPKKKRYKGATDPQSKCTCSKCGKRGHNKAGCERWHRNDAKKAMKLPWREEDSEDEEPTESGWFYCRQIGDGPALDEPTVEPIPQEAVDPEAKRARGRPRKLKAPPPPPSLATTSRVPTTFEEAFGLSQGEEPVEEPVVTKRPRGRPKKPKEAVVPPPLSTLPLNNKTVIRRGGRRKKYTGPTDNYVSCGLLEENSTSAVDFAALPNYASAPTSCSLCNTVGHNDRDCKENLLQYLEKQRQEKEATQRIRLLDEESEDEAVVIVDVTQDEGEDGRPLSSSTPNLDEDFISMMAAMREE
jgi:hypothetical protein